MATQYRYVNRCKVGRKYKYTTPLKNNGRTVAWLIWGDRVKVLGQSGNTLTVSARGEKGTINASHVEAAGNKGLLEVYVIDVGQGDGVLMRTPQDNAWHLIDAGIRNNMQDTKKGAANFICWKFLTEMERSKVSLKNVIMSHPDFDHYGGLLNVLGGDLDDGRNFSVQVTNFYHPGMGRFSGSNPLGKRQSKRARMPSGAVNFRPSGSFITELLDGKGTFKPQNRSFSGAFADLAKLVASVPSTVKRLGYTGSDAYVPGYEPGGNGKASIKILGPILEDLGGNTRGMRYLSSESKTRNGHSIVLRVDYGEARILLTGDLNEKSMQLMTDYISPTEFASTVAKGCHHGSEDIDFDFIKAIGAKTTVISSGDNEDYAHPRPIVIGASGRYGRDFYPEGSNKPHPPLVYSTELSRSVALTRPKRVRVNPDENSAGQGRSYKAERAEIKGSKSGQKYRDLERTPIATNLIYGLVNVRTDGNLVMCATMEEKGSEFDIKVFQA